MQPGKHNSFRQIKLMTSANMYESSGSHSFRTTTEIQSGQMLLMNQGLL